MNVTHESVSDDYTCPFPPFFSSVFLHLYTTTLNYARTTSVTARAHHTCKNNICQHRRKGKQIFFCNKKAKRIFLKSIKLNSFYWGKKNRGRPVHLLCSFSFFFSLSLTKQYVHLLYFIMFFPCTQIFKLMGSSVFQT